MKRNEDNGFHTGVASTETAIIDLDAYRKDDAIRRRLRAPMSLLPASRAEGEVLREAVLAGLEEMIARAFDRPSHR